MTGSVYPDRQRWRVQITTAAGRRKSLGTYDTEAEAELVLAGALRLLDHDPRHRTLRQWGEEWLNRRELDGVHRAVPADRRAWKRILATAPWADRPLEFVERRDVGLWVRDQVAEGLGAQTVRNRLNLLRVALRDAQETGLVEANAADGVRVPRIARADEGWTWLRQAEIEQLLGSSEVAEPHRIVYTVAIYSGLRLGELWGLRWRDVELDPARPHLVVRRSYGGPTKGGRVREVPLLLPALQALQRQWRLLPGTPDAPVWPSVSGGVRRREDTLTWADKPRWATVDGRRVRRVRPGDLSRAGIGRHVRFHDQRHTCASHLVMGTWVGPGWIARPLRLEEVRDWLGHRSITTTERYAHLAPEGLHGLVPSAGRERRQDVDR